MPAVAVRHERRKGGGGGGQDKRSKRPSHLYIGGHWLPPTSPSPTPSPNGPHDSDHLVPEYYLCGKVRLFDFLSKIYSCYQPADTLDGTWIIVNW